MRNIGHWSAPRDRRVTPEVTLAPGPVMREER